MGSKKGLNKNKKYESLGSHLTRYFSRWFRKIGLSDVALCQAVKEMEQGLIFEKMREFEVLCRTIEVPEYDAEKIRSIRDRYKLSQSVLSSILNISLSTVRQWEIGKKRPSGPLKKLLNLLDRKGLETLI